MNKPDQFEIVYSNKVKLNALKTRQECIEIMGWTTHPAYEEEYKEIENKIQTMKERNVPRPKHSNSKPNREGCNIRA